MSAKRWRRVALMGWLGGVAVWSAVEGGVTAVALLGGGGSILLAWWLLVERLAGWRESAVGWLVAAVVVGLFGGAAAVLLTLGLMAFKTGLHGHGPEFLPADIAWVVAQGPFWAVAGGVAGLGVGLLTGPAGRPPSR